MYSESYNPTVSNIVQPDGRLSVLPVMSKIRTASSLTITLTEFADFRIVSPSTRCLKAIRSKCFFISFNVSSIFSIFLSVASTGNLAAAFCNLNVLSKFLLMVSNFLSTDWDLFFIDFGDITPAVGRCEKIVEKNCNSNGNRRPCHNGRFVSYTKYAKWKMTKICANNGKHGGRNTYIADGRTFRVSQQQIVVSVKQRELQTINDDNISI